MENLEFEVSPYIQLTHKAKVSCGSDPAYFLIGSEKWDKTPSCNLSVASRMDDDLSLTWNINGHKVKAEVEGACWNRPDNCLVKIPQEGCKHLIPPKSTVFLNVEDYHANSVEHQLDVLVHRVPEINCSVDGPKFFNLAWDNQRMTIHCEVSSVPVLPLKNVTSRSSEIFKHLLGGEVGEAYENGTSPTKVVSKVSTSAMTEEDFKRKLGCEDEIETKSFNQFKMFEGNYENDTARRLAEFISESCEKPVKGETPH